MRVKVILWGFGKIYNTMLNLLKFYSFPEELSVVGITAETIPNCKALDGWSLISNKQKRNLKIRI